LRNALSDADKLDDSWRKYDDVLLGFAPCSLVGIYRRVYTAPKQRKYIIILTAVKTSNLTQEEW
jgi:hypothetical protein